MTSANQSSALKQALVAIERLQAKIDRLESRAQEPIAICGIGCRFPRSANTPEAFWQQLVEGVESVTEVPLERWDNREYYDPDPDAPGKMSTRWAATLEGIDQFDPGFFGITPREAASLDPQQRLLLECTWEALENAGQDPRGLRGQAVGVYVGIINDDYGDIQLKHGTAGIDAYFGSGNSSSVAAGRISYVLGLNGPAVSIDTACSSSLVALHLACQSLRTDEIPMAIVGGVNVTLLPESTVALSRYKMMSLDGHCKTFDADADGYVRGEGCGIVVLKRLSEALAAGDPIAAIIRATAVNQDGASSGLTVPNGPAQESVIRASLEAGRVAPADVTYVEAHGTGTSLGDPIEIQALHQALGHGRRQPLYVGSVKTNIGHLESAAGIAGLIKAVLVVQHRFIPPHLHLKKPNPLIPWDRVAIEVPTKGTPFPEGAPAISSVSSFGFSGTNANVIVEAPHGVISKDAGSERPKHILALSAATEPALTELRDAYREKLAAADAVASFADVCYSAAVGRAHHAYRAAVAGSDLDSVRRELDAWSAGEKNTVVSGRLRGTDAPRIAVMFTGQGSQYAGMGRTLYDTQPTFRATLDRCNELLRDVLPIPLLDVLYGEHTALLDQTLYTQPALFAIEYALMEMWASWGVRPVASMGHSLGEYVAACRAGVFSLEDGLRLVAERSRQMQSLPSGGSMAAVLASEVIVREVTSAFEGVGIAAVNGPENTVISGDVEAVNAACARFAERSITTLPLTGSHAFHSARMQPMLDDFERYVSSLSLKTPRERVVSNLDGCVADGAMSSPGYWRRHVSDTVRFADGIATLNEIGCDTFLEIGPNPTLITMAKRSLSNSEALWVPSLQKGRDDWDVLLQSLAQLYARGVQIDWAGFDRDYSRRHVLLPTYPFQRSRYWFAASTPGKVEPQTITRRPLLHPLLGNVVDTPLSQRIFEAELNPSAYDFVYDHRINGTSLLPASAFLEMVSAAGGLLGIDGAVEDLMIQAPMVFAEDAPLVVQTIVESPSVGGAGEVRVFSSPAGMDERKWTLHASGRLTVSAVVEDGDIQGARERCSVEVPRDEHYRRLHEWGFTFGPAMQTLQELWRGDGEALARVQIPGSDTSLTLPPALLDGCMQCLWAALPAGESDATFLPLSFGSVQFQRPLMDVLWSHVEVNEVFKDGGGHIDRFRADVHLYSADGAPVGSLLAIDFKRTRRQVLQQLGQPPMDDWFYETQWSVQKTYPKEVAEQVSFAPSLTSDLEPILQHRHDKLVETFGLATHAEMVKGLGSVAVRYLVRGFRDLGFAFEPGLTFEGEALRAQLNVLPKYDREFRRLLTILAEDGFLERSGEQWRVRLVPPLEDPEPLVANLLAAHSDSAAQIEVTARCGRELAALLRGTADPLAMIFPGGSLDLAEQLYRHTPEAKVYSTLLTDLVLKLVAASPSDQPIRIAELGAGTGGVTSFIVPQLPIERMGEYRFTDVSRVFLNRAKTSFANYSFMQYGMCDVQRDPSLQGVPAGSFDIVIAANMIHATANLKLSLANARSLLRPGGTLVLMEGTGPDRWIDITFGLTDGWWLFSDDIRHDYPLLDRETWRGLLGEAGFENPIVAPAEHPLSRQAIMAASALTTTVSSPAWVLADSGGGLSEAAAAELRRRGAPADCVASTELGAHLDDMARRGVAVRGVAVLSAVDTVSPVAGSTDEVQREIVGDSLDVVQTLIHRPAPPELVLVTCGAQPVGHRAVEPAQATVWGLAKVIDLEHSDLRCRRIDLDVSSDTGSRAHALVDEMLRSDDERLVARRGSERHVGRLVRASLVDPETAATGEDAVVRLTSTKSGVLDELKYELYTRHEPGPGEVEIEVRATGLSFRDVMNALSMRDDEDPLGAECSGVVARVGEGVTGFKPGDEVVALTTGAFDSHVVVSVEMVALKPARLSFEQAAATPTAFTTAWHALGEADLKAGETVLIHAGAGGVGLAAVEIAQSVGARVIATAGNDEKRSFLRSRGVDHVFDSRSLAFSQGVLDLTEGRGVDVVLNSLAGDFIGAGVQALAEDGRFLEIGKRDIWDQAHFNAVRPNARYFVIDLAARSVEAPAFMGGLLRRVLDELSSGRLRPLPLTSFAATDVVDAFRYMSQARQIGKIVVRRAGARRLPVHGDVTYLVAGGTTGIGLETASWLFQHGARSLVLLSRSGARDETRLAMAKMEAAGARVVVVQADVADEVALAQVLTRIEQEMPPLAGVVHAAGVLHDAALVNQDWEKFRSVFAAKVEGAWNLHHLIGDRPLDFFLLYSSTSALFGAPGQANHAAANAFLDALAWMRTSSGLEAQSINWGVWSQVGSAAARDVDTRIVAEGALPFTPDQGLEALERVLIDGRPQVAVVPVRWERFLREFVGDSDHPWWNNMRTGRSLGPVAPASRPSGADARAALSDTVAEDFQSVLLAAPRGQRREMLLDRICVDVIKVIGLNPNLSLDTQQPLSEMGLDSLMAVELRNLLASSFRSLKPLPATLVFDHPTIGALADYMAPQLPIADQTGTSGNGKAAPPDLRDDLLSAIETMSDEDVARLYEDSVR